MFALEATAALTAAAGGGFSLVALYCTVLMLLAALGMFLLPETRKLVTDRAATTCGLIKSSGHSRAVAGICRELAGGPLLNCRSSCACREQAGAA